MQLPHRDDRRRRVLSDEAHTAAPPDAAAPAPGEQCIPRRTLTRFGDSALMDAQPRLIDIVPRKIGTLVLWFLAGVTVVAGLEALYAWMPEMAKRTTDGRIEAFDLDGEGSLAVWFSSFTLAAAAVMAVMVYFVRRQRVDDYHGRYRLWLWAAACWLAMSLDETASLHEGFKEMMSHLTGWRLFGDGSIWWVMAYGGVLGVIGVRLLLEVRDNRAAVTFLSLTALAYGVAVIAQLGWVMPESGARGVMLEEGCEMVGNLLLLLAMTLQARWVIMDAEGLIPAKAPKPKKERKAKARPAEAAESEAVESESRREKPKRAAEPAVSNATAAAKPASKPVPAAVAKPPVVLGTFMNRGNVRVDAPDSSHPQSKLSKAERRALRRQLREEQD